MGIISYRDGLGASRSDISDTGSNPSGHYVGGSAQSLNTSILSPITSHFSSLHNPEILKTTENETPLEDLTEEWICHHFPPGTGSNHLEGGGDYGVTQSLDHGSNLNTSGAGSDSRLMCSRSWDGILCWPETPEGSSATLSCFSHLNGIQYDTSRKLT